MTVWQRLLERFVPEIEDASPLDRLDGVGTTLSEPRPQASTASSPSVLLGAPGMPATP